MHARGNHFGCKDVPATFSVVYNYAIFDSATAAKYWQHDTCMFNRKMCKQGNHPAACWQWNWAERGVITLPGHVMHVGITYRVSGSIALQNLARSSCRVHFGRTEWMLVWLYFQSSFHMSLMVFIYYQHRAYNDVPMSCTTLIAFMSNRIRFVQCVQYVHCKLNGRFLTFNDTYYNRARQTAVSMACVHDIPHTGMRFPWWQTSRSFAITENLLFSSVSSAQSYA